MKQKDISETIFFDTENPTKNLDNLIWKYRALKENIGNSSLDIEKSRSKLIEYLHEHQLYNTGHRAIQEIKRLVKSPNFNNFSIKYLEDAKQIIEEIENLNIQYSLSNINNLGLLYYQVITPLSSFINEVSRLVSVNTLDNNSVEEKQEIININTIQIEENPFSNIENYHLFIYINDWFKPRGKKAKYSYILEHFQKEREKQLIEKPFFEFVERITKMSISRRKQPSANNQEYFKQLNVIEQDFIKTNTIVTKL